jgi:ATP-dependent Clp protease ATP-binding subunit ClpB
VRIKDEALVAAATLSNRYITNRYLPDKAIDLVDEAASQLKMEIESQPDELDQIERRILQLNIEDQALSRETDKASEERRKKLHKELGDLKNKRDAMHLQWVNERSFIAKLRESKARLEQLNLEEQRAEREGDLAKAAQIKHGQIPELVSEIERMNQQLAAIQSEGNQMLREEVSEDDIARIVSNWTGVPVAKMKGSEMAKYLHLEEALSEQVVGQKQAIEAVSNAIRRNKAGISDEHKPLGTFLFAGPTGCGKTLLAKVLGPVAF